MKMKKYDFDTPLDRRDTSSLKWDVADGELPMWVADMDFATAPQIVDAVTARAKRGGFGYNIVPDEWYSAIIGWWKDRHGLVIDKADLCFCTGVLPAISCLVKRLTNIGDNVLVQTPVFNNFFNSIENAGRRALENRLTYADGKYEIDFADLEAKLALPTTTLMILCNPHNPVGKIWSRAELAEIADLAEKYGVTVISDEIHCDLTEPDADYVPFASVSEKARNNSITCISASKTFSLPGLQAAAVFAHNARLRNIAVRGLNSDEVAEPNCFAVDATVAAFEKCGDWLDALREYISENRKTAARFIGEKLPELHMLDQNATYLLWVDCSKITDDSTALCDFIRRETGLFLSHGAQFRGNGNLFVRINIACPRSVLVDGLDRFYRGVKKYEQMRIN